MLKKPRKKYKSAMVILNFTFYLRDSKYSCKGNYKPDDYVAFDIEMFLRSSANTHGYGFGGGQLVQNCREIHKPEL